MRFLVLVSVLLWLLTEHNYVLRQTNTNGAMSTTLCLISQSLLNVYNIICPTSLRAFAYTLLYVLLYNCCYVVH